jgi:hypothetical protein
MDAAKTAIGQSATSAAAAHFVNLIVDPPSSWA